MVNALLPVIIVASKCSRQSHDRMRDLRYLMSIGSISSDHDLNFSLCQRVVPKRTLSEGY